MNPRIPGKKRGVGINAVLGKFSVPLYASLFTKVLEKCLGTAKQISDFLYTSGRNRLDAHQPSFLFLGTQVNYISWHSLQLNWQCWPEEHRLNYKAYHFQAWS